MKRNWYTGNPVLDGTYWVYLKIKYTKPDSSIFYTYHQQSFHWSKELGWTVGGLVEIIYWTYLLYTDIDQDNNPIYRIPKLEEFVKGFKFEYNHSRGQVLPGSIDFWVIITYDEDTIINKSFIEHNLSTGIIRVKVNY